MRLFIGVPVPEDARAETLGVLRRLKQREWPVRWVRDEGLHLTLKFFGEVTSDRVEAIIEMIDYACRGVAPIGMSLSSAGVFPTPRQPRVIHLAVDAESSLELLQDRIERGADTLGFPPEGRPFRPHLTLGRVREGHRLPGGWESELERIAPGSPFLADRIVLFESQLAGGGPSYSVRHEVTLR